MNPAPIWRNMESVRRSLFGPVDHDQLRRDLKQRLKDMMEEDSRRWNFNFHTDTPLSGRFEWEEIPADCAAAFYQDPAQVLEPKFAPAPGEDHADADDGDDDGDVAGAAVRLMEGEGSAATDQENCPRISNTRKCPAEVTPVRRKRAHCKAAAKPRNNAQITDFFAKRRRTTENKSSLNHLHSSSSEAASCKTIR